MDKHFACPDPENYVPSFADEIEHDYDDFRGVEARIEKFKKTLKIFEEGSKDSFFNVVLFGTYLQLNDGKGELLMDREKLKSVLGESFLERLEEKKPTLYLDYALALSRPNAKKSITC